MDTKVECLHRELIELVRLLDGGLADGTERAGENNG